ncbi:hypothetical protein DV515_00016256 [Chloebia gouldiae]|uniref:Uncharacterized protein n=1 Tax=Chloebia gouldiae TaxID=44316 RepID=A0A3L8RTG9_CHLGU|nr:hypothetical protein DV515_00016256 [Chloebia gouldiae]
MEGKVKGFALGSSSALLPSPPGELGKLFLLSPPGLGIFLSEFWLGFWLLSTVRFCCSFYLGLLGSTFKAAGGTFLDLLVPGFPDKGFLGQQRFYLHLPKMTFLQGQCDDDCYYGGLSGYRGYDCGSPCSYRGYGGLYGSRGLYGFGDRYGSLYGYRGIFGSGDCYGSGGLYGGYRGFFGSGDCYGYPGYYSGRYGYPFGYRYGQRFGFGGCYSC